MEEVERVTRTAGKLAMQRKKKITSVDKANVLATSRMWRKVVERVLKDEFPEVSLDRILTNISKFYLSPFYFKLILIVIYIIFVFFFIILF